MSMFSGFLSGNSDSAARLAEQGSVRATLIAEILELNPSATVDFLSSFSVPALEEYRAHLRLTTEPRGRSAAWTRRPGVPGIVTRAAS